MRDKLPAEPLAQSALAWVEVPSSSDPVVRWLLRTAVSDEAVVVAETLEIPGPPGALALVIPEASPIVTRRDGDDAIDGFVLEYPPVAGAGPPRAIGLVLPMAGAGVGGVQFQGLLGPASGPDCARKELFDAAIDPLRPFDGRRTYLIPTGLLFELCKTATGFEIRPVASSS